MSSSETAFVLSEFSSGNSTDYVPRYDDHLECLQRICHLPGRPHPSFTAQAYAETKGNLLIVPLCGTPSAILGPFVNQLASGYLL
jgi:hypothetical protein